MKNLFYLLIIILGIISYQQITSPNNNSAVKEKTAEQNISSTQQSAPVKKSSSIQENVSAQKISNNTESNSKRVSDNTVSHPVKKTEEPKKEEPIVLSYKAERYLDEIIEAGLDKNFEKAGNLAEKFYYDEGVHVTHINTETIGKPCPKNPNPKNPEITVNGKTYSGKVCTKLNYRYKEKPFEAGKCRNWVKEN